MQTYNGIASMICAVAKREHCSEFWLMLACVSMART